MLTGGAASQTNAGSYAVTADFVPAERPTTRPDGAVGRNFVIQKATPTATLAVDNSPVTYNGAAKAATVAISTSSVPGSVANILTGGAASQTNAGTYAVTADFVPARYGQLQQPGGAVRGRLRDPEGDADGDPGGEQLAGDV